MERPAILVVEDDDSLREIVVETLRENGYHVLEAGGGRAALDIARRERPALVLCDVSMVDLDGWGVLRALRADPDTASIPVVFLTGDGGHERQRDGMALGADDVLAKPVREADLIRAVEARLARRAAAPEL